MSELTILIGKNPQEAAQVLAAVTKSLLPQPGIAEVSALPTLDSDVIESVLKEIRQLLRVPEDDFSRDTQSKIFAFLSREISEATFTDTSLNSVRDRLGNRGQLRPNQYQVVIDEETTNQIEAMGNRISNVIEAVTNPDEVVHLQPDTDGDRVARTTISIKFVAGKKPEDDFILLTLSYRNKQSQYVSSAFRVYGSDVDIRGLANPLDVLRAFVEKYGLKFRIGNNVGTFIEDVVLSIELGPRYLNSLRNQLHFIDGSKGDRYFVFLPVSATNIYSPYAGEITTKADFAFAVNVSKYAETMKKHNVKLTPEEDWKFAII